MTKETVLKARNLHKSFYRPVKVPILKGVDLEVEQGETVAILGRSGQGKSTLLNILGTLDTACQGSLEIAGKAVSRMNKSSIRNIHLAFIFQSFHLLEDYTAMENVLMPAKIGRRKTESGSDARLRAEQLLNLVGLSGRSEFYTKLLSGGEKQRVAIARALCNDPDIILADEPSGNLDNETSRQIHNLLIGFAREHGKTLIVVTHNNDLAALCDKRYILEEGHLHPA